MLILVPIALVKKLTISVEEMQNIIKSLKYSGILIKGSTRIIQNKIKEEVDAPLSSYFRHYFIREYVK